MASDFPFAFRGWLPIPLTPQVLIDESTQATEPECLIPMVLGAKQVKGISALSSLEKGRVLFA